MFEPATSVAVTVTTAVPSETGVTRTVEPDDAARATDGSDDVAP